MDPDEIEPYVQLVLKQQAGPVVKVAGGVKDLRYKVYEGKWDKLPDFKAMRAVSEGRLPKGFIDISASGKKEYFGMVFEGKVEAPRAGDYTFEMASDDGARMVIGGEEVILHDGLHGAELKLSLIHI